VPECYAVAGAAAAAARGREFIDEPDLLHEITGNLIVGHTLHTRHTGCTEHSKSPVSQLRANCFHGKQLAEAAKKRHLSCTAGTCSQCYKYRQNTCAHTQVKVAPHKDTNHPLGEWLELLWLENSFCFCSGRRSELRREPGVTAPKQTDIGD
jgi:hypothetical protein